MPNDIDEKIARGNSEVVSDFYALSPEQVPPPPYGGNVSWACALRWCVAVMDHDDKGLSFVASCLSYAVKSGGLSIRQQQACDKILNRVVDQYQIEKLDCQVGMETRPSELEFTRGAVH